MARPAGILRVLRGTCIAGLGALVATSLAAGIAGGLLRAGVAGEAPGALLAQAGLAHAALMIGGFLGTVIGIERAVALKRPIAFGAPIASGLGALLLLAGQFGAGATAFVMAGLMFVCVNVLIVHRQPAAHTALLLVGAAAWLAGNVWFAFQRESAPVFAWWFVFLVTTIAAERLEMTRLLRRRPGAQTLLFALLGLLMAGAALATTSVLTGGVLFGAALTALGLWLAAFDVARRTVLTRGLSRYMAVCLLGGYAWLVLAGIAWIATTLGLPARDAALHALGLGFVLSMVMGHAPVILPAITGLKLKFSAAFYLPLVLLHGSLLLRLWAGLADDSLRSTGAALNAAAIGLFVVTVVVAAIGSRAQRAVRSSPAAQ
jgi:hypothetical protein